MNSLSPELGLMNGLLVLPFLFCTALSARGIALCRHVLEYGIARLKGIDRGVSCPPLTFFSDGSDEVLVGFLRNQQLL